MRRRPEFAPLELLVVIASIAIPSGLLVAGTPPPTVGRSIAGRPEGGRRKEAAVDRPTQPKADN